jgi:cadmium resistance protein CadD (predicted permease)
VLGTLATAAGVFAGTNVDDLLVLTVLFLAGRATGRPEPWQIWTGQYAGVGALVAASAVAALGLLVVPDRWVGLLGLVPLALGIRGLVTARRAGQRDAPTVATGALSVTAVTVANGADNLAVYTPLLRTISLAESVLTVAVFAVGVGAWCLAGSWLGGHAKVVEVVRRYGHWIVPAVFVLIGVVIVMTSEVIDAIQSLGQD